MKKNDQKWSKDEMTYGIENLIEVALENEEDFLKIKETLTRIGIASKKEKKLFQSCHILHKRGKYYIVHFKELFALDGKPASLTSSDIARRNTIADLLDDWDLCTIVSLEELEPKLPKKQIDVISFADKVNWELIPKYVIGNKPKKKAQ